MIHFAIVYCSGRPRLDAPVHEPGIRLEVLHAPPGAREWQTNPVEPVGPFSGVAHPVHSREIPNCVSAESPETRVAFYQRLSAEDVCDDKS